ncbi:MAG: 3-deoxy-D-manno-octulosonic acid transferase [Candidatus Aadella gelida]|nr:3-deoxy-D-manno-octulosonic acid transferase [Candidatus Aadella gelida]
MRILYNIFFVIFSVAYIPCLLIKGKWHKGFFQKFGILPDKVTSPERPVWIHAVSVGEAVLAVRLAGDIKRKYPDVPVVISTTTATGNKIVRSAADRAVDAAFYYPLDIGFIVARVVRAIRPRVYVMVETELWPNILTELKNKGIPVVLANGRISDNSFRNYSVIRPIIKNVLKCIDLFCMQTQADAERIRQLGALSGKVCVSGNMKFCGHESDSSLGLKREALGFTEKDSIIVAGSTHYPEEKELVDIFMRLGKKQENLKLVIAPRHVERTGEILKYIEKQDKRVRLFSKVSNDPGCGDYDILIVDTIGSLKNIYAAADIVFIGGSIAKRGGQNPIEAARWGKTVIFGPHMFNFREMKDVFLENSAAIQVSDAKELERVMSDLLGNSEKLEKVSSNIEKVISENSGAVEKTLGLLDGYIRG